jgi:PAT family beta-lactamase induction signal transducer AmpG
MTKKAPPIWLMGMANGSIGAGGAVLLLVIPQLLASDHVPEPRIAEITGLGLATGFTAFLLAPMLDVRMSRRTWAMLLAVVGAGFNFLALMAHKNLDAIGWLLFAGAFAIQLNTSAIGGWLGGLVSKEDEGKLAAAYNVWNIGAFGVTSIVGIGLLRNLPFPVGAAILSGFAALPILVYPFIPAPPPDRRLARESFSQFSRDLAALVRKPEVLLILLFFMAPAASFALTNTLGGLGKDYLASETFVSLVGGVGTTIAGIIGSLMVPPLAARVQPRNLYLMIGAVGACFTLGLLVLPHTPFIFAAALTGENIAQSAAFTAANTVMFRALGKNNPFAATQFAMMLAAQMLPLTYMQLLDGRGYGAAGLSGLYLTDAGLGLAGCAFLVGVLALARRRVQQAFA